MTSTASVSGFREGDVLAGKYRIDKVLGIGGMGVVVAAHHLHLDERVAIKFLLPALVGSTESVARFAREARAVVKIKSEHVARVSDVGTLENGAPYMVMEYLQGNDLAAWLRERGALSIDQTLGFVLQACEALAEAHALGIVHRDLKPANLFVVQRPDGALSVKVLDFGISKMRGAGVVLPEDSITKTTALMGSPLYMSPEQLQSAKNVDSRTDIWAIGVVMHELLTGEPPFRADSMPELVAKILSTRPPPLSEKFADAPAGLQAVILKCLARDREQRFESIGELAAALMPFAPHRSRLSLERISGIMLAAGLSATVFAGPRSLGDDNADANTQGSWERTSAPGRRTKLTLAVVGLVLGVVGMAFLLAKGSPGRSAPPTPGVPEPASMSAQRPPLSAAPVANHFVQPEPAVVTSPTASSVVSTPRPTKPVAKSAAKELHRAASTNPAPSAETAAVVTTKPMGAFDDRK
jgi:serine/threonine protein kinase